MRILEEKLNQTRAILAHMSKAAMEMLQSSTVAILTHDLQLAREVIKSDGIVDRYDNEIDELCFKILAIYNPRAFDLRFVISALRISVDLERVGDSCVNIAKQVKHLAQRPPQTISLNLNTMAKAAYTMLEEALKAFFENDVKLALTTIKRDDEIDALNKQIIRQIVEYMGKNPQRVMEGTSLVYVVRNIERIADHATNVCELVYFKETGKSIKHTYFDSVKEVIGNGNGTGS